MRILALDPATLCGWAHSCGQSGTWDLNVRRDESSGMRLIRLRGKLRELGGAVGMDLIVFEAARHCGPGMQGALVTQAEFQAVIKEYCHDEGIDYRGYSPAEIKKHATGKGSANKQLMREKALRKWLGASKWDDNEIDARWLLDLAMTTLAPKPVPPPGAKLPASAARAAANQQFGEALKRLGSEECAPITKQIDAAMNRMTEQTDKYGKNQLKA